MFSNSSTLISLYDFCRVLMSLKGPKYTLYFFAPTLLSGATVTATLPSDQIQPAARRVSRQPSSSIGHKLNQADQAK